MNPRPEKFSSAYFGEYARADLLSRLAQDREIQVGIFLQEALSERRRIGSVHRGVPNDLAFASGRVDQARRRLRESCAGFGAEKERPEQARGPRDVPRHVMPRRQACYLNAGFVFS